MLPGIESDVSKVELRFTIIDIAHQDGTINVIYKGAVPDTFDEGRDVIVEGKYTPDGIFEARSVVTRCASKYIPEEVTTEAAH